MRHKVFSRLGTIQRSDTFRNRSPNTSRPPSLHVDDFVAMETRSARQPRYKLPVQPIQVFKHYIQLYNINSYMIYVINFFFIF